jgi:hypothetical protein
MNARTCGVGSLKINFAVADIFHAKLGTLEVRKPIPLLCDDDSLAITEKNRPLQGISTIRILPLT